MRRCSIGGGPGGGIAGRGTDFCAHIARQFWSYAKLNGVSAAQIFADVVAAFESVVVRELVHDEYFDFRVVKVLQKLGFGPDVMEEITKRVGRQSALSVMGSHAHLSMILAESLANS